MTQDSQDKKQGKKQETRPETRDNTPENRQRQAKARAVKKMETKAGQDNTEQHKTGPNKRRH
jgi:hypothetical protein